MFFKVKKIIFIGFLLILTGCSNKIAPNEQLKIQTPLIPIMIGLDSAVYADALKQEPSNLTLKIYDSSVSKGMFLKKVLQDTKNNDEFENDVGIVEINSLCLMGKLLLSEKHKTAANLQGDSHKEFYGWLSTKQQKWEKLLSKEDPRTFDDPCLKTN